MMEVEAWMEAEETLRDLFLLEPGLVFLNHGSFGACPREVFTVYQAWQLELERNPVAFLGRRSAQLLADSRRALANHLGARMEDLVYVTNATSAVNAVARSLDLGPGDEVLTTDHEYGACVATWELACRHTGARLVKVPIPLPFEPSTFTQRLVAAMTPRTRVLFLSHITSTTALVFPLAEVLGEARRRGILSLVDGAHAPGQIPLDLDALGADFTTGNCHKWLCAPKGAAFLHVRPEHHGRIDAPVVSWGYCESVTGYSGFEAYTGNLPLERRHQWQGTRDLAAFLAVPEALAFLQRHQWDRVRERCHALALETRDRILEHHGMAPVAPDEAIGQMVAVPLPPCDPGALQAALFDRFRIEVPLTTHGPQVFVRVSFQGYNTRADADALVAALAHLLPPGTSR